MINLDELEKKARAATPGPWVKELDRPNIKLGYIPDWWVGNCEPIPGPGAENFHHTNAEHIAACSPDVILTLIEVIRRQREALEFYGDFENWSHSPYEDCEEQDYLWENKFTPDGQDYSSRPHCTIMACGHKARKALADTEALLKGEK